MPESVSNLDIERRVSGFAHQDEGSPIERMRELSFHLDDRLAQGIRFRKAGVQADVKLAHQLGSRAIVHCPKADDQGGRSSVQKTASKPEKLVAFPDRTHTCFARAQHGKLGAKLKVENVEEI